jgi:hypothetical protein
LGRRIACTARYTNVIELMQQEGSNLQQAWNAPGEEMLAPQIAIGYWRLAPDATLLDVMKQVAADETNHRDVNHTFALLARDDPNPFLKKHTEDLQAHQYWQSASPVVDGRNSSTRDF